jgi:hypothetical protein
MSNPSTIWAQLASPNQAAGSIPFVANDNVTIVTDVTNISYNSATDQLTLTNQIQFGYTNNSVPAVSLTCNSVSGRVKMTAGAKNLIVLNSKVSLTSIILATMESNDATAVSIKSIIPSAGQFVITLNAAATSIVQFSFFVVNS